MRATDARKQRAFIWEIIRYIVSRNGLYSKRGRTTADSHLILIITAFFEIGENFDILLSRTVIGKSFYRVILVIGARIVLKPDT
jgi:hypothetical protein